MAKILAFDVSSVSTGWALLDKGKLKEFGTLQPHKKYCLQEKLYWFKNNIITLLKIFDPDHVVAEETYLKNVTTLKVLMQFITVVNLECFEVLDKELVFISPLKARSYYTLKDKQGVFDYMKNKYKVKLKNYTFTTGNDISDAILIGLYYHDVLFENGEKNG